MRLRIFRWMVMVLFCFTSSVYAWSVWHDQLTQSQRDHAIIDRAYQDLGKNVDLNCKNWARKVVYDASAGGVTIPQTLPDADGWYWAWDWNIEEICIYPEYFRPGAILQMNWLKRDGTITPHTAIVSEMTSTGMYLLESNWIGSNTVGRRFVSFSEFYSKVTRYTVHYIH